MTIRDNERTLGTVLEAVITLCYPKCRCWLEELQGGKNTVDLTGGA
jgi:hypothetical protein